MHRSNLADGRPVKISVVIPCYKDDRFLAQAIRSVLEQTHRDVDLIVIDDGSPEPLPRIDSGDPRVTWVRTVNCGLGAARNAGIARSEGDFVAFLDADDFWEADKLEKQVVRLTETPAAVACYTRCVDAEGFFAFGPYPDPDLPADDLAVLLWHGQFFPPSSVLVRTEVAKRVGGFREGLTNGEDLDFWFRILEHGEIVGVSEPLCWYRQHEGQITSNPVRRVMGSKQARRQIIERFSDRLIRGEIAADRLWDAYRSEILCVYYRRQLAAARPMLWDFWKDHPRDLRMLAYWLITWCPPELLERLRGKI